MEIIATRRSHSHWVDCKEGTVRQYLWRYLKKITKVEWEKVGTRSVPKHGETFATKSPCGRYVGLVDACYHEFIKWLSFQTGMEIKEKINDIRPTSATKVSIEIKPEVTFKDEEQAEAYNFLTKPSPMHILECRTGFGKTFLGIYSSAKVGELTVFLMQPRHIKTWLEDIPNFVNMEPEDIEVARGKDGIINLLRQKAAGKLKAKFIFIASDTFREYIKAYRDGKCYHEITPDKFFDYLGVGRVVRDEAHEAVYSLCIQNMYLNVRSLLCLSATIISEDKFDTAMYERIFPKACRWKSKNNGHIEAYSVRYSHEYGLKIKTQYGHGYSHVRYEKEILKRAFLRDQYYEMIYEMTLDWKEQYEKGMKMLVFCALTDMCKWMAEKFRKDYPDMTVNHYVAETDDEVLKESDIIVTTLGSCGTGKNIINLMHTYNTVAIGSKKQAWQALGRLREPKNYPHKPVKYYFFSNMSIPSHRKYEATRRIDLIDKTKFVKQIDLGVKLRRRQR